MTSTGSPGIMRIRAKVSRVMPKNVGINNPTRRAIKLNIAVFLISRSGKSARVQVNPGGYLLFYFTWVVAKLLLVRGLRV